MRALVTGASGFIGGALAGMLAGNGWSVCAASRRPLVVVNAEAVQVAPDYSDLDEHLQGVDVVFHAAGGAHDRRAGLDSLMNANARLTGRVAAASAVAGVSRLIHLSTLKVQGEERDTAYSEADEPRPEGPYAVSKLAAERAIRDLERPGGLTWTIVRPPLVYGPGVGANFLQLMRYVHERKRIPVPAAGNRRSLVSLRNLCDVLMHLARLKEAENETFLVSDGDDLSTAELVSFLAGGFGRQSKVLRVPSIAGGAVMALPWIGSRAGRLLGSLQADISHLRSGTGWAPPFTARDEIVATARWYQGARA